MYRQRAFVETDLAALDMLVARDPFATLVSAGAGTPEVSHLPVLYARQGDEVRFRGHWSRANPQWRSLDRHRTGAGASTSDPDQDVIAAPCPVLLVVHGPHAYVSPSWYEDKAVAARVPTWNYAVAHVHGLLEVTHAPDALADIVAGLSARHEAQVGSDWRYEPENPALSDQLKGIVGFSLTATHVALTFKLSQNHPPANILGVAGALSAQPGEQAREIAALMRSRLADRTAGRTDGSNASTDQPTG